MLSHGRIIWFHSHPIPSRLPSVEAQPATLRETEKLADVRGGEKEEGEEPNHTTASKPGPL
jgi:hypothetical protein